VSLEFKALCKAVLKIRGRLYAAVLVDLPCIIEASKTLDMKNIIKTADVSQMLLVKQRIQNEEAIKDIELTAADRHYPHGLTPPMHYIANKKPPQITNSLITSMAGRRKSTRVAKKRAVPERETAATTSAANTTAACNTNMRCLRMAVLQPRGVAGGGGCGGCSGSGRHW
jgi:hypothetical protein